MVISSVEVSISSGFDSGWGSGGVSWQVSCGADVTDFCEAASFDMARGVRGGVFLRRDPSGAFPVSLARFSEDTETCGFSWSRRGASVRETSSEGEGREGLEKCVARTASSEMLETGWEV